MLIVSKQLNGVKQESNILSWYPQAESKQKYSGLLISGIYECIYLFIFAELQKRPYIYSSLQFLVEMNNSGCKASTHLIPFQTIYYYSNRWSIGKYLISRDYLHKIMLWP